MEKTTKKDEAFEDIDNFVKVDSAVVEDSPKEGNQTIDEEVTPTIPDSDKDSQGQPATGEKTFTEKDVSSAISKANEKSQKQLEIVVGLLKDNPEKLEALEKSDPKLIEKLKKRSPELFDVNEVVKDADNPLSVMLSKILDEQENAEFESWRKRNKISEADYVKESKEFKEKARVLYDEKLVKTWTQALDVAGKVTFPHLDGSPVDIEKIEGLKGETGNLNLEVPNDSDEFDVDDIRIMRKTGLEEGEYKRVEGDTFNAPGIN